MEIEKELISDLLNISSIESIKHLGITLDFNLKWDEYIDNLCQKLRSGIYTVRTVISSY